MKEPVRNRLTEFFLKLQDYTFDLNYQWQKKMFVSDTLSGLHKEAKDVHDVIPLNFPLNISIQHTFITIMNI